VDHPLVGTAHQFGLSLIVCGDRFIPLAARNSRFHPAQEGPNPGNPRPIDHGAPFRLPDALLGGSVLGHHQTFSEVRIRRKSCNRRISARQLDRRSTEGSRVGPAVTP
jgi:hypothetical protein